MCRETPLSVSLSVEAVLKSDGKLNLFTNKKNRVRIPWSSTDGRAINKSDLKNRKRPGGFPMESDPETSLQRL